MATYLGLLLATVGTLAVPPFLTGTVDKVARSTNYLDVGSGDGDERTLPLLVAESGGTLESDGGAGLQLREVQSSTRRNGHILDDNGSTRSLALDGRSGISESAACTGVKAARGSRDERTSAEEEGRKREGNHDVGSL
jgi:hypothetical protein